MGRRRKVRLVAGLPFSSLFKPQGVPAATLRGVVLPVEGLEALRLADAEGLSQDEAAERMGVSRPTLCRMLGEARATVARALSQGWAIRIEGGDYQLSGQPPGQLHDDAAPLGGAPTAPCRPGGGRRCDAPDAGPGTGQGMGQGMGQGRGGGHGRGRGRRRGQIDPGALSDSDTSNDEGA